MMLPTWNLDTKKATERRCDSDDKGVISYSVHSGNKRSAGAELPHPSKKRKLNPLHLDETLDELSQEIPILQEWESILLCWDSDKEEDLSCGDEEDSVQSCD
mmetsp:Transcript_16152/g.23757  ORF Transcript_16152/g.23757 Transcript_16152/m.23757 type:complete len:102 (+) Transcript_16152:122-427(+)|eukprot:CAMPEP_0194211222 /NCGR_PEP_ID=MMETSP0156-20130528/9806_1 /TAXON_ID=33649 /ORGANISM="Thalassionema nitzschioides, Strain L26-B" /LENGTH=101 /DNA_ID=CAMNT_0038938721 /DNA_START=64 /DNA_END=369 /DNA_ORIENTATION=+